MRSRRQSTVAEYVKFISGPDLKPEPRCTIFCKDGSISGRCHTEEHAQHMCDQFDKLKCGPHYYETPEEIVMPMYDYRKEGR